jgi:hypothetical protein
MGWWSWSTQKDHPWFTIKVHFPSSALCLAKDMFYTLDGNGEGGQHCFHNRLMKLKHTKRSSLIHHESSFPKQLYKQKKERTPPPRVEIHQVELSADRIEDNYEKNWKDGQRDIWCGGKNSGGPFLIEEFPLSHS